VRGLAQENERLQTCYVHGELAETVIDTTRFLFPLANAVSGCSAGDVALCYRCLGASFIVQQLILLWFNECACLTRF
jgi:hypothetical protein